MARPHPVVGVASKLAYVRRGRTNQTHVGEHLIDIHKILVAIVERLDDSLVVGTLNGTFRYLLYVVADDGGTLLLRGVGGHAVKHLRGNVLHPHQAGDRETWARQFLGAAHGPEAISQVVVLHRAVRHYVAVAAMVVGKHQTLVGDNLARASAAEQQDGIFQTSVVDVVNIFG